VTDKTGLEIATAVLCGVVNKDLTASITRLGGRAIGLSGVDGSLLQAQIKVKELGYVGTIEKVNSGLLEILLKSGYIPVIASISFNTKPEPGQESLLLNVNADAAAGEIAATLKADKLVFLTDIAGICDKSGKVISSLTTKEAEAAIASGVASGGMIPKIRAGIRALDGSGETRIIDGRQPHALLNEIENGLGGTTIYTEK
jgi:acetylglutamate kinase